METLITVVVSVLAGFGGGRWQLFVFRRARRRELVKQEADRAAAGSRR